MNLTIRVGGKARQGPITDRVVELKRTRVGLFTKYNITNIFTTTLYAKTVVNMFATGHLARKVSIFKLRTI